MIIQRQMATQNYETNEKLKEWHEKNENIVQMVQQQQQKKQQKVRNKMNSFVLVFLLFHLNFFYVRMHMLIRSMKE